MAFLLRLASSWLFFDTPLRTSGLNLDEPTQFAGRTIMLGLSNDEEGIVVEEAQKLDDCGVVQLQEFKE